jgi:hypothetical protein
MKKIPLSLVVIPAALLAGFIAFITVLLPVIVNAQPLRQAEQPVPFPHGVHVQAVGMDCQFCHRTASVGWTAGYPDVQQCMFCHQIIGQETPRKASLDAVRNAWKLQQPLNWTRIHRLPDHVRFVHEAHITAGVQCQTCHGDIGRDPKLTGLAVQVRPLNMGDCISCHRANNAPTECATCHK